jgi:hypothetical protein
MALTLQQQLDEARVAYHALQTGTLARVVVDQTGQRVEFTAANKANLYLYIQELLGLLGQADSTPISNGPARFVF